MADRFWCSERRKHGDAFLWVSLTKNYLYWLPSRTSRASLGAGTVRYTFTVTDFHRLPFAGLPAHPFTASTTEVSALIRPPSRQRGRKAVKSVEAVFVSCRGSGLCGHSARLHLATVCSEGDGN